MNDQTRAAMQMAWQPIETAPKDGTEVILFGGAKWAQGIAPHRPDLEPQVFTAYYSCGIWQTGTSYKPEPTHWMPFPQPPNSAQPQGEWVDLTYMELLDFRNPDVAMAAISKFKEKNAPKVVLRLLIEALRALDQEPNYNVSLRKCIRAAIGEQKEKNTQPVVTPDHIRGTTKKVEIPKLRRAGSFGD